MSESLELPVGPAELRASSLLEALYPKIQAETIYLRPVAF